MELNFIDFEVFEKDWLCVIIRMPSEEEEVIVNDSEKLRKYYKEHEKEIFVGYNIRQYDQFIMKGIMLGFNPKKINDEIIMHDMKGFEISDLFYKIKLNFFDVMTSTNMGSLKRLEAFMGDDIHESTVPFDIKRKLTDDEINETIEYCRHDVTETINVFVENYTEFEAVMMLIKMFDLPMSAICKTKAQLSAMILGAVKQEHNDEWNIEVMETLVLNKPEHIAVKDWFMAKENHDYSKSLEVKISGIPTTFAFGGVHNALPKFKFIKKNKKMCWHLDVNSFYPALMIIYHLLSRNVKNPEKFKEIRDKRLELKKLKDKMQGCLKIVINGTFGITKDKYNPCYDPRQANMICINGQLFLLDLIEKLEDLRTFKLVQSNTDGLIVIFDEREKEKAFEICDKWEERTGFVLERDEIVKLFQKDVNNYIAVFDNGSIDRKGAWVKKNSSLDNDCPILNKCLFNYLVENKPVEDTVNEATELIDFQKVVRISSKYKYGWHNDKRIENEKTFRVFASRQGNDGIIGKQKEDGATIEKFGNTPEKCFIDNGNIKGKKVPFKLDRQYYIDLANERIKEFC